MNEHCFDADDFGFEKIKVPAGYEDNKIKGDGAFQYVDWYDSGLKLNGETIFGVVNFWNREGNVNNSDELSAWCPWYGRSDDYPSVRDTCVFFEECQLEKMCVRDSDTIGIAGGFIGNNQYNTETAQVPCIMKRGVGLYTTFGPKSFNPNYSYEFNQNPKAYGQLVKLKHMGWNPIDATMNPNSVDEMFNIRTNLGNVHRFKTIAFNMASRSSWVENTGGIFHVIPESDRRHYIDGKLFFKILDRRYTDTSGQYIVTMKSGYQTNEVDPFDFVVSMIVDLMFGDNGIVKSFFNSILKESGFLFYVRFCLNIYIVFYVLNFFMGNVQISAGDLFIRLLKLIIVSQLLKPTAWDFFNDNFFKLYLSLNKTLIDIIKSSDYASGPGSSSLIMFMIAPHTIVKLMAILGASWLGLLKGIVYVISYFIILTIIMLASFNAAVLQISAFVMLALLMSIGPLFITFILFERTRGMFETWSKKLLSYTLQPIIIVTAITLLSSIIKHNIYATLGYRVCKFYIPILGSGETAEMNGPTGTSSRSFAKLFVYRPVYSRNENLVTMQIPEGYQDCGGVMCMVGNTVFVSRELKNSSTFNAADYECPDDNIESESYVCKYKHQPRKCKPYECTGLRRPSFPFLDPANPLDEVIYSDFNSNGFVPMNGMFTLLILAYLMLKFNQNAVSIVEFLTNSSGQTPSLSNTVQSSAGAMRRMGKNLVMNKYSKKLIGGTASFVKEATGVGTLGRKIRNFAAKRTRFVKYAKPPTSWAARKGAGVFNKAVSVKNFTTEAVGIGALSRGIKSKIPFVKKSDGPSTDAGRLGVATRRVAISNIQTATKKVLDYAKSSKAKKLELKKDLTSEERSLDIIQKGARLNEINLQMSDPNISLEKKKSLRVERDTLSEDIKVSIKFDKSPQTMKVVEELREMRDVKQESEKFSAKAITVKAKEVASIKARIESMQKKPQTPKMKEEIEKLQKVFQSSKTELESMKLSREYIELGKKLSDKSKTLNPDEKSKIEGRRAEILRNMDIIKKSGANTQDSKSIKSLEEKLQSISKKLEEIPQRMSEIKARKLEYAKLKEVEEQRKIDEKSGKNPPALPKEHTERIAKLSDEMKGLGVKPEEIDLIDRRSSNKVSSAVFQYEEKERRQVESDREVIRESYNEAKQKVAKSLYSVITAPKKAREFISDSVSYFVKKPIVDTARSVKSHAQYGAQAAVKLSRRINRKISEKEKGIKYDPMDEE